MNLDNIKDIVANQVNDASDLVLLLELSVEDIMERFADKLLEHQAKFGVYDESD
jgi:hypothetical protein